MVAHVDVLGARAVLVIAGKSDGGLRDGPKALGEKASQPKCLIHAMHHCHVLSLSIVDKETISWRFGDHEKAPPSMRNAHPVIALLRLLSSAMLPSVSAYPMSAHLVSPYEIQRSRMPAR